MNDLFARAVAIENSDPETALGLYEQSIREDEHAASYINAGTICYKRRQFAKAESYYRGAITVDPLYALAYFDLANVLDETKRLLEAVKMYKSALKISPLYADAHYNLALLYHKIKEPRKALPHWRSYLQFDQTTEWATHARSRIKDIMSKDLQIVWRNPNPKRTLDRAKLVAV